MAASEPTVPGSNDLDSFFSETSEYEEPTETTADGEVKARRKRSSLMNIHKNIKDKITPRSSAVPSVGSDVSTGSSKRKSSVVRRVVNPEALGRYLMLSLGVKSGSSAKANPEEALAAACLEAVNIDPEQKQWEAFSKWLQTFHLIKQTLPFECPMDKSPCPPVPAWGPNNSMEITRVTVKKRFNSRKQPHLIEFENADGQTMLMIFKQDDDISMDVSVMKLFEMCNEVWARRGMIGYLKTYKIVACPDLTGFGEIVPGGTMLSFHTDAMVEQLGDVRENWARLMYTLVGVIVATAIFDITDRHHNNVMFTPACELGLIDLSASLGKEAPMDKALRINPIYLPERVKNLREIFNSKLVDKFGGDPETDLRRWQDLEEAVIAHYYAIYNDLAISRVLEAVGYKMLKPHRFLTLLHERKNKKQVSEGIRNDLVNAMDESDKFNSFVAGVTRVIPMN